MKKFIILLPTFFGRLVSCIYSYSISLKVKRLRYRFFSAWISSEFKSFGTNSIVKLNIYLIGGKYISIGNRSCIGTRASLTAWDNYGLDFFNPEIVIGNNVSIGDDSHITAINKIIIGNNVLTGKKITITDNSHGESTYKLLLLHPIDRPLHSEGPVIIEEGVWIGDKVTILPNVRIGKNSIIAANAVVTKDIPANCVAGGVPAKIIKIIK
jgi:acetyltransferase-like isoleucine patch superfamily enzyme